MRALVLAVAMSVPGVAFAWDPVPEPNTYTGVVRVLDVALMSGYVYLALSDTPADFCRQHQSDPQLWSGLNGSWIKGADGAYGNVEMSNRLMSAAMWAKAQNLPVRVEIQAEANRPCALLNLRTCSDAAACALPAAP